MNEAECRAELTWWVNSGEHFAPEATVPVPAGGFVRRVARTPHYDGVKKGEPSPVVIGIVGLPRSISSWSILGSRHGGQCKARGRSRVA